MLKEAIERILSLADINAVELGGQAYTRQSEPLVRVKKPHQHPPTPLCVSSLTGLVDYLDLQIDDIEEKAPFLHVVSNGQVDLCGWLQADNDNQRFTYAQADLKQQAFVFNKWHELNSFTIVLQSQFVYDQTIKKLIGIISNQAIEAGLENSLTLRPYRTFREVEQPASQVILKLHNTSEPSCALFETDGGKWRLDAIENIKGYLSAKLPHIPVIG